MKTTLYTHPSALDHRIPLEHAEQPGRLPAVLDALDGPAYGDLRRISAPLALREDLLRVHSTDYVAQILDAEMGAKEIFALDWDTFVSAGTKEAASRAAGAACQAVNDVMNGNTQAAFCAMRPPGHHARSEIGMGFCIFSNIAIAARRALEVHGLRKIAVLDFDVHHGNGTQEALWDVPGALFISLHQQDHYPGTGTPDETGGNGEVLNLPMAGGTSADTWMQVFFQQAAKRLDQFAPELILVSAGFDAHQDDPLGDFMLRNEHYGEIASELARLSQKHAQSRLVSVLEGGYDLHALGRSSAQFVRGLLEA